MLRHSFISSCITSTVLLLACGWMFGRPVPSASEQAFLEHLRLERMLDQPASLVARDLPLDRVLESLGRQYDVPISVDQRDVRSRQRVTIRVHHVRLRSLLSLILEPHDLEFAVRGGQVIVSSLATLGLSPSSPIARVYPLPIPPVGWRGLTEIEIAKLIETTIAPHSWGPVGGGDLLQIPGALVIVHLPEVHVQIIDLLDRLESWRFPADPTAVIPIEPAPESRYEQRLRRLLQQPANVELFRAELRTALEFLSRDFDVPIVIHTDVTTSATPLRKGSVTVNTRGVPLEESLHEILAPFDLTFRVQHDVIHVMRPSTSAEPREFHLYPVGDLTRDDTGRDLVDLAVLLNQFAVSPEPDFQFEFCSAEALGDRMLLVEATPRLHEEVERLLEELRSCLLTAPTPISRQQRAIQTALDQAARLAFQDARLEAAVPWIQRNYGVPIEIDTRHVSLWEYRIACDIKATRLDEALHRMLRAVELDFVVLPDRLVVTELWRAEACEQARCFDVRPLIDPHFGAMSERILQRFIQGLTEARRESDYFQGVLILSAPQHELPMFAESIERLRSRLPSLPRYQEFLRAHLQSNADDESGEATHETAVETADRLYLDALLAAIEHP